MLLQKDFDEGLGNHRGIGGQSTGCYKFRVQGSGLDFTVLGVRVWGLRLRVGKHVSVKPF